MHGPADPSLPASHVTYCTRHCQNCTDVLDGNEIFNKKLFATRVLSGRTGRCHLVFYRPPLFWVVCLVGYECVKMGIVPRSAAQSLTFGSEIFSLRIKMFDFLLDGEMAGGTYRNCHCYAFPMGLALDLLILERKNEIISS